MGNFLYETDFKKNYIFDDLNINECYEIKVYPRIFKNSFLNKGFNYFINYGSFLNGSFFDDNYFSLYSDIIFCLDDILFVFYEELFKKTNLLYSSKFEDETIKWFTPSYNIFFDLFRKEIKNNFYNNINEAFVFLNNKNNNIKNRKYFFPYDDYKDKNNNAKLLKTLKYKKRIRISEFLFFEIIKKISFCLSFLRNKKNIENNLYLEKLIKYTNDYYEIELELYINIFEISYRNSNNLNFDLVVECKLYPNIVIKNKDKTVSFLISNIVYNVSCSFLVYNIIKGRTNYNRPFSVDVGCLNNFFAKYYFEEKFFEVLNDEKIMGNINNKIEDILIKISNKFNDENEPIFTFKEENKYYYNDLFFIYFLGFVFFGGKRNINKYFGPIKYCIEEFNKDYYIEEIIYRVLSTKININYFDVDKFRKYLNNYVLNSEGIKILDIFLLRSFFKFDKENFENKYDFLCIYNLTSNFNMKDMIEYSFK